MKAKLKGDPSKVAKAFGISSDMQGLYNARVALSCGLKKEARQLAYRPIGNEKPKLGAAALTKTLAKM